MWQADTLFGPYVRKRATKTQTELIAFIDDASRVCCHAQFFLAENTDTLIQALRSALYKRGVPETLYVDKGSPYASKEIAQICSRLGCLLCHTPVRDGAAKGKVGRLFRTMRMSFLTRNLNLTNIDTLNRDFTHWVEEKYNGREHSAVHMRPIDRFGLDLSRIRFLPPNQVNEELFFVEEDRTVLAGWSNVSSGRAPLGGSVLGAEPQEGAITLPSRSISRGNLVRANENAAQS